MSVYLYTFTTLFTFIFLGLLVWLIREKLKDREDPADDLIIENYLPQYANGHTDGVVDSIEHIGDRVKIRFFPRDIKYSRFAKEKLTVIKPLTVIYRADRILYYTEGSFSAHRNKIKAFPNNLEDLPEGVKRSAIGKGVMVDLNEKNEDREVQKLLNLRLKNQNKVLRDNVGLEIVSDHVDLTRDLLESYPKMLNSKDEVKK